MYNLGKNINTLNIGRKLPLFTGVIIHAGQNDEGDTLDYSAGTDTGYVLEVDNPIGTQQMADSILAGLKLRGIRYQSYTAESALLDPALELGDNVLLNGTAAVIYNKNINHSPLMETNISAPYDEEIDHAFKYEPKIERQFKRESAYTRSRITQTEREISLEVIRATDAETSLGSRITLTEDSIAAEVTRATTAEGTLSSQISVNAASISAKVSKTGGQASSFGWVMDDSSHTWSANGQEVMRVSASGLKVKGEIEALSGEIGGCLIENGVLKIANANIDNINATKITAGYLSVDRIESASLTGTKIAAATITGGSGGNLASLTVSTLNTVSGINTNLGYAAGYGAATASSVANGPDYFNAGQVRARGSLISETGLTVSGTGGASFSTNVTVQNQKTLTITGQSTLTILSGSSFSFVGYSVSWKSLRYVSDVIGGVPEYTTVYYLGR